MDALEANPRGWQAAKEELRGACIDSAPPLRVEPHPTTIMNKFSAMIVCSLIASFIIGALLGFIIGSRRRKQTGQETTKTTNVTARAPPNGIAPLSGNKQLSAPLEQQEETQPGNSKMSREHAVSSAGAGTGAPDTPLVSEVFEVDNSSPPQTQPAAIAEITETVDQREANTTKILKNTLTKPDKIDQPEDGGPAMSSSVIAPPASLIAEDEKEDVQAAARLVTALMSSLHVQPADLTLGERVQMINTVVHAWQAQQMKRHGEAMQQLGSDANVLRSQQTHIAQAQATHKIAKDAHALAQARTQQLRTTASDIMYTGILVMLGVTIKQAWATGGLEPLIQRCGSLPALSTSSRVGALWGIWALWRGLEAVLCYCSAARDAVLGLLVLLAAPWLLYRTNILTDYHTMPVFKLFAGLGVVCGVAGFVAVGRLGGAALPWVVCWEAWVLAHIALSAAAHALSRRGLKAAALGDDLYGSSSGWLGPVMWVVLGGVLPIMTALAPFNL